MILGADDKKWITKVIIKGVVDGINQVMIPYSEDQEKRFKAEFRKVEENFGEVRNDISELQSDVSRIERKLDNVTDHQADKLDDHERRIGKLELVARI